MTRVFYAALALCAALLFTSCGGPPGVAGTQAGGSVPAPGAGKAAVVGRVLDSKTGAAMTNTPVRLAEVYRSGEAGAYVLDGSKSPGAVTNASGDFVFPSIPAREYVLVVGDLMSDNVVIADASGQAKVWNAESGKVLDVGTISIDLKGAAQQQGQ